MKEDEIEKKIRCGETSRVQFKRQFTTQRQIAEEMVAFANCEGGDILFGVDDKTGAVVGLDFDTIQQVSRELGNTANEHVRPTIYIRTDVAEIDGKMILVATILPGRNKPYKDLTGCIWVKQGADKRRVTENSEILALFQQSSEYHPDEAGIPGTSAEDIDSIALNRFFDNVYRKPLKEFDIPKERVLRNLHITDDEGRLTTAGLLFFGQEPQRFKPLFVIKAVWFYGNSIAGTEYRDSRDIEGTIPQMYKQAMQWVQSCLHRPQCGQSFNSIGKLEIPEPVLEELLQNALVHIDLLKPAAIRLLVFDNRVEITNPGCIAGGHTLDEVMLGNSFARNPLMANFCAKMMPYRGLGSGIPRILSENCHIEFIDSKEGDQFTARVSRPEWNPDENKSNQVAEFNNQVTKQVIKQSNQVDKISNQAKANEYPMESQYSILSEPGIKYGQKLTEKQQKVVNFCAEPRSSAEIMQNLGLSNQHKNRQKYISQLVEEGYLAMTHPEAPNSPMQRYVAVRS